MSEKIEMWKTDDGKLWVTEENVAGHEKRLAALAKLDDIWYNRCIECQQDFIDFLDENPDTVKAIIATKE